MLNKSDHIHLNWLHKFVASMNRVLIKYSNSASHLNLFVRYCSWKNPAFWSVQRFLGSNSRTTFLPRMLFLQKVRRALVLWYSIKKVLIWLDYIFIKSSKTPFLGCFWTFRVLLTRQDFFSKNWIVTFFTLWIPNFMQKKIRKKLISQFWDLALQTDRRTGEWTNRIKFMGHFCQRRCPTELFISVITTANLSFQ